MIAYFSLLFFTALASFMPRRDVLTYIVFAIPTVYIIGLKYEVGTDWSVYSNQFIVLSEVSFDHFVENFWLMVFYFQQEPLFILTLYGASQAFAAYELFQCAAYIAFIVSVFYLGRGLGKTNVIAAFIPIHAFILFTLEMSTLRQMIAVTMLNIALGLVLRRKIARSLIFSVLAPLFQASAAVFVAIMYWTRATRKTAKVWLLIGVAASVLVNLIGFSWVLSLLGASLPGFLAQKAYYYSNIREYSTGPAEQVFWIVFYAVSVYFCASNRKNPNPTLASAATFGFYLSIFAIVGWTIPTVRNRFLYEIVIIVSLLMFTPGIRVRVPAQFIIIPMGIFFFVVMLTKQTSFMYVPYQNYVWYQLTDQRSDGEDRQRRLDAIVQSR